jgi:serine/threonine protein kinase
MAQNANISVDLIAASRAELGGKKRSDFTQLVQIGGANPAAVEAAQAAQAAGEAFNGCNGRIFSCKASGGLCGGRKLVLKVVINMNPAIPPEVQFKAEYHMLLDVDRLPAHPNLMPVFSHFIDRATGSGANALPNWDLDGEWMAPTTSFIVMPFFPRDLKNALASFRHSGTRVSAKRARRIACDVLKAVIHLQAHRIAHRDLKPDNVLLQNVESEHEQAVLTDFGEAYDFVEHGHAGMSIPYVDGGLSKGGAIVAMSPEIFRAVAGPGAVMRGAHPSLCACMPLRPMLSSAPAAGCHTGSGLLEERHLCDWLSRP